MSDTILVPVTTVQPDLVTQTDVVVYVPLASKTSPGIVQIGEGLNINNGVVSVVPIDVPIMSISKNGTLIFPDENKNVNIVIDKSDVGLSNVDNTSDLDKPISNATQQAINNVKNDVDVLKTTLTDNIFDVSENLKLHIGDKDNPHAVTKAQVGLSEVDNTSDKNKPISDAAKQALDTKMDKSGGIFTGNVGVQGNLSVSGTIITKDTETLKVQDNVIVTNANKIELLDLSGLAINKNDTQTYGIMYDAVDDGVKLGLGSIDSDGKFTFNEGEGSPVATRSNSSSLTDNHLIKWDATNNKLVDSGYSAEDKLDKISTSSTYQRVYGINSDGTQTTYNVSVQPEKDSIVCRDYYGRIGSKTFYANYINNFENWDTNSERRTHITLEPKSFEMVSYIGSQYSGLTFTNDTDTNSDDMSIFGEFMGSKTTPDYAKQIGFSMNYNNVSYLENGITLRVLENLQNGKILSLTQNGLFIGDGFDAIPEGEQTLPLKNKKEISPNTIRYDIEQTLTDEQKAQARANIGAGTGSGTGGGTTVTVGGVAQETWDADSKVNTKVGTNSLLVQDVQIMAKSEFTNEDSTITTGNMGIFQGMISIGSQTSGQNSLMLLQPSAMEIGHTKGDIVHKLLANENSIGIYDKVVVDGNTLQGIVNTSGGMAAIQASSNTAGGGITVQPDKIEITTPKLTYNGNEVATTNQIINKADTEKVVLLNKEGTQNITSNIAISGDLNISGNIIQQGSAYETHAESVYTKNDYIITRDGAVSGLGNGEYTGIVAKLYDGTNDGRLIFDNKGVARVGDAGDEQPLATREETPIDKSLVSWDENNNKFVTHSNIKFSDGKLLYNNSEILNVADEQTITGNKNYNGISTFNNAIYLTNIADSVKNSVSKIYFGNKTNPYAFISANISGAFGLFNTAGNGVVCYPEVNFFPLGANLDLGRTNNKWKDLYLSGKITDGTNSYSVNDLSAKFTEIDNKLANQVSSASVTELIGTEENPINLSTLEKGKMYSLSGVLYSGASFSSATITPYPVLASVLAKEEGAVYVDFINCKLSTDASGNITIGPDGTGAFIITDGTGAITIPSNHQTIDENMDAESTNPVQNKVIKTYIDNLILTTLNTAV